MRKEWFWIGAIAVLLSACSSAPPPPYNGPTEQISGVEPRYEPYNSGANQDYSVNGKSYKIVKDPQNFTERGRASWYGAELQGNKTAIGEQFEPYGLTAAHPTLPIPSYVRVTNLNNGRRLVVRINDRGPFVEGRIIDLSKGSADRLNITAQTPVQVDFINVSPDGQLSGPGTVGTVVAKQNFALPDRPTLPSAPNITPVAAPVAAAVVNETTAEPETAQTSAEPTPAVNTTNTNSDFKEPKSTNGEYDEYSLPNDSTNTAEAAPTVQTETKVVTPAATEDKGNYMVQVGALSSSERASEWQEKLSSQFSVSGKIVQASNMYRIQLGPFSSKQQAVELQQRLQNEAQQSSFITAAP